LYNQGIRKEEYMNNIKLDKFKQNFNSEDNNFICICIVRLRTNTWSDSKGLHSKKSLRFLRRRCKGHNLLEEDSKAIGADEIWPRIINLDTCEDGVYQVVTCNESRDYETGSIDDYDYELIPIKTELDSARPMDQLLPTLGRKP
jgi:hypothetical protein